MDLARERLAAQAVTCPVSGPAEVVARLLAMQAQDWPGTCWAVALRCGGDGLEAAMARGEIVRCWPMRGTLHLVRAADARWMVELMAPRVLASTARRRAQLELDDVTLGRCREHLEGRTLARAEALALLEGAGIRTDGQRGYHILVHLALQGVLVQVGRDVYAPMPDGPSLPRDQALARLVGGYFAGHGPATLQDLQWWSGLPLRDLRAGLAEVDVERRVIDGVEHYGGPAEAPAPGVQLLPGFDEMLLGYRDRSAMLDPAHANQVCPGGNGVFRPTVVVDGRMVGTWRAKVTKRAVKLSVAPFDEPIDPERLRPAAQAYASFLGRPEVVWA